jgi:hypothetical protein
VKIDLNAPWKPRHLVLGAYGPCIEITDPEEDVGAYPLVHATDTAITKIMNLEPKHKGYDHD